MPRPVEGKQYTVYLFHKNYYCWTGGDHYDDFTYVQHEFADEKEADRWLKIKRENPDTNCSYYVTKAVRDFPACKKCGGSKNDIRELPGCCGKKRRAWLESLSPEARKSI